VRSVKSSIAISLAAALMATVASAQVNVSGNITTSTTWTANNVYNLVGQVYVTNGATLTIEPGTVIATTANSGGSLAITRGSKIEAVGTKDAPIIFTSTNDDFMNWRAAANEWGNVTLMGNAYISEDAVGTNSKFPSATNVADMEGLTTGPAFDRYGGGNDDDDSGTLAYVSLRYGGKVVSLANELNGLSCGGIGRETDIHHVEIMNNVDDGIETWGGTVNYKYVSIWNVGDDSFDVDQGWRGKAQNLFIVQGYSLGSGSSQGSGIGDNCFEVDGAEQCYYQPVTSATIYNATVIGQPLPGGGDHGTAWRDNARVQYRNCIFMDLGDRLVSFDNIDGDGGLGYGCSDPAGGTTLTWAQTWTTAYNSYSTVNPPMAPLTFADLYQAQTSGNLAEIKDSVFFNNNSGSAYTEAIARGVLGAGATPANNNLVATAMPIQSMVRAAPEVVGGLPMTRLINVDPRPANDALTSVAAAPADGFFTPQMYRGAFAPGSVAPWVCGWTASYQYGYTPLPATTTYCTAGTTTNGCNATISATGVASASAGSGFTINVANVEGNKSGLLFYGISGRAQSVWSSGSTSFLCVKSPTQRMGTQSSGGSNGACDGSLSQDFNAFLAANPASLGQPFSGCETIQAQAWFRDPPAPKTTNLSNGLEFYLAP